MIPHAVEIRALPPEVQAVVLARVAHELALDRAALGLSVPPLPDPARIQCGCPASELRETHGIAWCARCSP